MLEKHPFGVFVPKNTQYLLLGNFVAKKKDGYDWFYANGRNQFWTILEAVYKIPLKIKKDQQKLFTKLEMAITDIILECDRMADNNLDTSLTNCVFNISAITEVLKNNKIRRIYFTSRFVEKLYKKEFTCLIKKYPRIELITLPSPSPRYALMSKTEKIKIYKKHLPSL